MTDRSVALNPTIFLVTHPHDPRLSKDSEKYRIEHAILSAVGVMYGSYYRPDEFWDEPVFVCPQCKHVSQIVRAEKESGFYCKYCSTDWVLKDGQIYREWTPWDDHGNPLSPVLI